ncbi:FMN-binding glutamate synthase family protein [Sulfobacillus thermosulfidooxidans]|uniref:FMN-binding glutamate synthase family protein n=1 Tax=Sulfobacillus thermosulfidooxidans TaxID=28034 RepID=UPI0006B4F33E|nr:FMN-binding glutamate synthase family protein [Sulfobacillus thermosulfidooxidans]
MENGFINPNQIWTPEVIEEIQEKAELGRYRIRGMGRAHRVPNFDDLVVVPAGLTRIPLEGYRERCETRTVLGTRHATQPIVLDIPITIAGMSFGALSLPAKRALGFAATQMGTSTTTGDGGMHPEERQSSKTLVYQYLPARYGQSPYDMKRAEAVEIVVSQGAKPGAGGLLLGYKISSDIAQMRDLPPGVDQRSPVRHPDWMGPDDLVIKIEEIREITEWRIPIYVKIGASRVYEDVTLAAKAGADVVVVDGMEGGTAASVEIQTEHTGIPTLAAVVEAHAALRDLGLEDDVQLIISGGIRSGVDAAKALALGATAVSVGTATLLAMGCNDPRYAEDFHKLGTAPYYCHACHTGKCPVGITTQDPVLTARLDVDEAAERIANFLYAMTLEIQTVARSCGKSNVHHLDATDLRSLTLEASLITGIPLVGQGRRNLHDEPERVLEPIMRDLG